MSATTIVESPLRHVRAFPNLARVVGAGRATRATVRWWRSTFASLSALGEARMSGFRTPGERARALSRLAGELLAIHGVEVVPVGVVPARPCVVVANHASLLDPLVVLSQLAAVPILPAQVAAWPVFGTAAAALGARFAAPDDPHGGARVLRGALDALRAGVPVVALPEAAPRGRDRAAPDRVERFHRGVFGLAILADLPVVPVALRVEPADRTDLRAVEWTRHPRTRVTMTARAPMWGRPGEAPEDLALRARTAIALTLYPAR